MLTEGKLYHTDIKFNSQNHAVYVASLKELTYQLNMHILKTHGYFHSQKTRYL